ncbi:hypothetical protein BJ742DRAFT_766156 [Cladochytrium replicatum]|nr:hypothetical protein BJ742DRAFT_766156 [Cladochytrium replicatum]
MPGESTPILSDERTALSSASATVKDFTSRADVQRTALVWILFLVGLSPFTFYPSAPAPYAKHPSPGKFDLNLCGSDGTVCSNYVVPMHHLDSSDAHYIPSALVKIPASREPLFINPGERRKRGRFRPKSQQGHPGITTSSAGIHEVSAKAETIKCFANGYQQHNRRNLPKNPFAITLSTA